MKQISFKWTLAVLLACSALLPAVGAPKGHERVPVVKSQRQIDPETRRKAQTFNRLLKELGHRTYGLGDGLNGPDALTDGPKSIAASRPVARNHATRSVDNPRGNFYTVVPTFNGGMGYFDAFFAKLNGATGELTKLYIGDQYSNHEEYDTQTGCIVDGILYIPKFNQDMVTLETNVIWKRIEVATGRQLSPVDFGKNETGYCYGLTYDPNKKLFYGLGMDLSNGTLGDFVEIDINDVMRPTAISLFNVGGSENDFMASVAYCPVDGRIYGLNSDGCMYVINPQTLTRNVAITFDSMDEDFVIPQPQQPGVLCYSPRDNAFVTIFRNEFERLIQVAYIDFDSNEAFLGPNVKYFGKDWVGYNASLNCTDEYALNDAPDNVKISAFTLKDADLNGSYTITAPVEYYSGVALPADKDITVKISMDGEVTNTLVMKPGETYDGTFTVAQGMHKLSVRGYFGELEGPMSSESFWAGHDNPVAPSNVKFDENVVTWSKSTHPGIHGGYVENAAVRYNVYVDGVKLNAEPINGTTFTCEVPAKMKRRNLTVTAEANGMESLPSTTVSIVNGEALTLPQKFVPTAEESTLMQEENMNRDEHYFKYYKIGNTECMGLEIYQYSNSPKDWLFLPKMKFDRTDIVYNVSFTYSNFYTTSMTHESDIHLYIGKAAKSSAMTKEIFTRGAANVMEPVDIQCNFILDEPGEYYIGFYTTNVKPNNSRGVRLYNFAVEGLENKPLTVPSAATDVKLIPAEGGDLSVTVQAKLPTTNLYGQPLDTDKDVELLIYTADEFNKFEGKAKGKPGQAVKADCEVPMDGYTFVFVNTANEYGEGIERSYRTYVGLDQPNKPLNVKGTAAADNMSYHMTWDPPTTGLNGGYIGFDKLEYDIYNRSASVVNPIAEKSGLSECEYTYVPKSSKQAAYWLFPVARNKMGISMDNDYLYEFLGKPHEMPMVETFKSLGASFQFSPWKNNMYPPYDDFFFSHVTNMMGFGIGDPTIHDGAFCSSAVNEGASGEGELISPKVSTKGIDDAYLGITFWDYDNAASFDVYGRRFGHDELEKLFSVTPEAGDPKWVEWSKLLPAEYQNCDWVQFRIRSKIGRANNSYLLLDEVKLYMEVDRDFKVESVTGNGATWIGDAPEYTVTVRNTGMEAGITSVAVELLGDGEVIARQDYTTRRLLSNGTFVQTTKFNMKSEFAKYSTFSVRGRLIAEDEVSHNDMRSMNISVRKPVLPFVEDLTAKWDNDSHTSATLEWSHPDLRHGDLIDIEFEESFAITEDIAGFHNVDLDKLPVFAILERRFLNDNVPASWITINHDELHTAGDNHLSAHSGNQFLLARSVAYDEGTEMPVQANDWLISPEVVGDTELSFWLNPVNTSYKETVEVWVSSTGTELAEEVTRDPATRTYVCGDFKRIDVWTTDSEDDGWCEVSTKLPADTKYFAIVYCSIGNMGLCIDDISFTPKNLKEFELLGYDLYTMESNNWESYAKVAEIPAVTTYTHADVQDGNVSYFISPKLRHSNGTEYLGKRSNEAVLYSTSVEEGIDMSGIYGANGAIIANGFSGKTVAIYSTDGKYIAAVAVESDNETIPAEAGIYLVKCGKKIAKVIVK